MPEDKKWEREFLEWISKQTPNLTGREDLLTLQAATLLRKAIDESRAAELQYDQDKDYFQARKWWRRGIGLLLGITALAHLVVCGVLVYRGAEERILAWVVTALTVEVLGLAAIILRHLFPKGISAARRSEESIL